MVFYMGIGINAMFPRRLVYGITHQSTRPNLLEASGS